MNKKELTYEQGYVAGFSHNKETIEKLEKEKKNLIKYLEGKIDETQLSLYTLSGYQDILEKIKNNNYE